MLIVSGTVRMDPGDVAKITEAAKTMMEATRIEDGCIVYEFSEVIGDPGLMRIFEKWESWDHLKAHFVVDHMKDWNEAMKVATVHDRDLAVYDEIGKITPL